MWVCLAGLVSFLVFMWLLATEERVRALELSATERAIVAMFCLAVPIVFFDVVVLRVHRRASAGLVWERGRPFVWRRILTKWAGLAATLGVLAFAYWAFSEYERSLYEPFFELVEHYGLVVLGVILPGIALTDRHMKEPEDPLFHAGLAATGRFSQVDRHHLLEHARAWTIKGFFFPLMFVFLGSEIGMVVDVPVDESTTFLEWYELFWSLAFAVDVVYSATGYATALRLLDTHVESSEPTVAGWLVALVCYEPFWGIVYDRYLAYDSGVAWGDWLADWPAARVAWACTILLLITIYSWASVAFGLRFSNLTRRGILTNGPYRFTKHPAYVAKNLAWWLVSIPFAVDAEWHERLRLCLLMLGVNFIYFLRAKTEERHLSVDPTYVAYAKWIDEHGIFRWLRWPRGPIAVE
jgi:hypothetical protein